MVANHFDSIFFSMLERKVNGEENTQTISMFKPMVECSRQSDLPKSLSNKVYHPLTTYFALFPMCSLQEYALQI